MSKELIIELAYIVSAILFIMGIKKLGHPRTARTANLLAACGMLFAVGATLLLENMVSLQWIIAGFVIGGIIGAILAVKIEMTSMPQMVAVFNGFGGLASALVAYAEYAGAIDIFGSNSTDQLAVLQAAGSAPSGTALLIIGIGVLIGGVTFTGSLVAFGKLQGLIAGRPRALPANEAINAILLLGVIGTALCLAATPALGWQLPVIALVSLFLGITLTMPVGGADMPVMVSLLNSYSGLAAAAAGFILANKALIVAGALVGASGLILTSIMCKAMNRSLANVLFARVGTDESTGAGGGADQGAARSMGPDDAALLLEASRQVMIVPGYGLAVAQAQHAVRDLANFLEKKGIKVVYAIHPVAGRMPGHMNVLLAEANIPYENLLELEPSNAEVAQTDVVLVLGANDVVNPSARSDKSSPIYGMPIIDVDKAHTTLVVKRSMNVGYSGVQNPLFFLPNTAMVFGDAKKVLNEILAALRDL